MGGGLEPNRSERKRNQEYAADRLLEEETVRPLLADAGVGGEGFATSLKMT